MHINITTVDTYLDSNPDIEHLTDNRVVDLSNRKY